MVWPDMTGHEPGEFYQDIYGAYFRRRDEDWPNFSNHLVPLLSTGISWSACTSARLGTTGGLGGDAGFEIGDGTRVEVDVPAIAHAPSDVLEQDIARDAEQERSRGARALVADDRLAAAQEGALHEIVRLRPGLGLEEANDGIVVGRDQADPGVSIPGPPGGDPLFVRGHGMLRMGRVPGGASLAVGGPGGVQRTTR